MSPPLPLPQEAQTDWDRRINELLARLAYFKAVCSTYEARDVFPGQTLLLTQRTAEAAALSGPAGVWRRIAQLVRPVAVHVLQAGCGAAVAQQVQRILWEVVHRCAVKPSAAAAAVAARGVGGVGGWVRGGGGWRCFQRTPKEPSSPPAPYLLRSILALRSQAARGGQLWHRRHGTVPGVARRPPVAVLGR